MYSSCPSGVSNKIDGAYRYLKLLLNIIVKYKHCPKTNQILFSSVKNKVTQMQDVEY